MTQEHIQIPRKITNQLLHLAQISPDLEVCGLIGSKNGLPSSCYPIKNTAEQPQQRFQLDPSQQISAMAKMRDSGRRTICDLPFSPDLTGHYHQSLI